VFTVTSASPRRVYPAHSRINYVPSTMVKPRLNVARICKTSPGIEHTFGRTSQTPLTKFGVLSPISGGCARLCYREVDEGPSPEGGNPSMPTSSPFSDPHGFTFVNLNIGVHFLPSS